MARYVQKSSYESTHLDNEWIILNTDDYTVTKLNDIGGFCWSLLEAEQTLESLTQAVGREYLETKVSEREIEEFLSQLMECGLVKYAV
ncbi:coenzyme PQQ synthesis protein D (PqqD) [Cytobacillus firmus]|uniref:Coenzyme PQQ synthesis protein D (PqqD) n=2 Tax=Cytobacillus TaxID=2675230 RepID=A0A366JMM3_CYTFI|nr:MULTISPECIES: PqqD family protein [Cytobacillus]RBP88262.1 coenzyme PQQ synthesis protein D (PqqD) [Cytobacillus firmus]TDX38335.1 coenzyme PQQ synthesis protein D (PqqD) [Cytobacillus oceanisediminis]